MPGRDAKSRRLPAWVLTLFALGGSPASGERVESLLPDPATRFVHQQWTVEDGLPVNNLNDVVQTPDGWLWIASFDGLLRFDGARFTRFDTRAVPELASNRIVKLEVGAGGTLWILPERGHPTRWAEGRFHAITLPEGAVVENARIAIDDNEVPWLLTNDGLFRVADDRLVESAVDLGGHRPWKIAAGAGGRIWLYVKGPRRFAVVEHDAARWLDVGLPRRLPLADMTASIPGQELWDGAVRAILRARDGRLLLGHRYGLLASRPGDPGADGWRFARVAATAGMRVRAILEVLDGEVWLATDGAGVARVRDGRVTRITTAEGLASDRVRALHMDDGGHLWIATEDRGLCRLDPATVGRSEAPEVAVIQQRRPGPCLHGARVPRPHPRAHRPGARGLPQDRRPTRRRAAQPSAVLRRPGRRVIFLSG